MPIVTFTTDFGAGDGYAGAMKGVVLSLAPAAQLVDITHGVPPLDVAAGAVALAQAAPLFPPGTIHIAVVDPGVGGARADMLVEAGGSLFIGPDNGVLSLAARRAAADLPHRVARCSGASRSARRSTAATCSRRPRGAWRPGATAADAGPQHRRDRRARRAAAAQAGRRGRRAGDPRRQLRQPDHVAAGRAVRGQRCRRRAEVQVEVEGAEGRFRPVFGRTFSDVESGALIAYIGSGGQLEIARRDGSAAARMGAGRGTPVRVTVTT